MTEAEKLADFYLTKFKERRLNDYPDTVPVMMGAMSRQHWVDRMEALIDKLDEIRFEHASR